jgi:hypothetical protein
MKEAGISHAILMDLKEKPYVLHVVLIGYGACLF